jgi:chromosome partitioning protein
MDREQEQNINATQHSIADLLARTHGLFDQLQAYNFAPDRTKRDARRYTMREAAEMVGRSHQAIRDAEQDGRLPKPDMEDNGRRSGFKLSQINHMRDVFGTRMRRAPSDPPITLAVQAFKGGVGKSSTAVHLGQYCARAGLRVLMIDLDPQASTTSMFGYLPDIDVATGDTILPYLDADMPDLGYAVRPTYYDGISLCPSNLNLYRAENALTAKNPDFYRLREGIQTVSRDFDIVIIDTPPSLGQLSLNALYAAEAMVIPMSLGLLDFHSTVSFIQMINSAFAGVQARGDTLQLKFLKVLMTRVNLSKPVHAQLSAQLRASFGTYLLRSVIHDTAAIDNAGVMMRTVYEMEKNDANRKTLDRARTLFDSVNSEILHEIRLTWPSHVKDMREKGQI